MDYRVEQLRYQLREDPTSRQFYQLGELLRREGELEEGVAVLRAGLEHHPRYLAAWVALGRALFDLHAYDEAEAAFARALALDPQNAVAAQMVGRAAARRGEWERAVKGLTLALALGPRDEELEAELEEARAHLAPRGGVEGPARELQAAPEPEEAAPEPEEAAPAAVSPPSPVVRSTEVAEVFADEPFAVEPKRDTGVFLAAADVFGSETAEAGTGGEAEAAAEAAEEPPPAEDDEITQPLAEAAPEDMVAEADMLPGVEPEAEEEAAGAVEEPPPAEADEITQPLLEADTEGVAGEADVLPDVETEVEEAAAVPAGKPPPLVADEVAPPLPEAETEGVVAVADVLPDVEAEAEPEVEPEEPPEEAGRDEWPGEEEAAASGAEEVPLPTVTLARLAVEQGDLDLAQRTVDGVLARDPESAEAQQLYSELRERRARVQPPAGSSSAAVRVAALQAWLRTFRLAGGRGGA